MGRSRLAAVLAALVAALAALLVVLRSQPGGPHVARAVDDLAQLAAAALASAACAWRARHQPVGARRSWAWLAAGTGLWAAGEALWSWYELISGRETPFPSLADAGFLGFEVLAAIGLLCWPSVHLRGRVRWRALLDGVQVGGSLFVISWVTTLGAIVHGGASGEFGFAVSLAYPVLDLTLLTITVTVVARARGSWQSGLALVTVGLLCLCVGDSGFAYLTALGRYKTGSPVDLGWIGGFLLVAVAAWYAGVHGDRAVPAASGHAVTVGTVIPYVPAAVGLVVAVAGEWSEERDRVGLAAAAVVIGALMVRQLLAILDNRRLVEQLVAAQEKLEFRAFHDPLTGLANRSLFDDRLRHGLELHRRDLRPLTLLYCDLDDFKAINDSLGHDTGDEVLKVAAERLRAATRAADTVARIGGDEFAVLIEDDGDPAGAARRVFAAFAQPAVVDRRSIFIGGTVGIVELAPGAPPITAAEFLRRADAAMYEAKRSRKGSATIWTEDTGDAARGGLRPVPPADGRAASDVTH